MVSQFTATTDGRRGWICLELGDLDQWIELIALPRHYGGRQWYFLCPLKAINPLETSGRTIFR